ncbi:MupA/Atu3671 family FMN-dependent luciferase-like monooxygenase [Nocardiopsis sp. NPDC049922]|uniref:non-ribosomal peptide synthetase/type I polyketide synthase n=1 Tax=Nocardiopsis sp. NPDC049922 TaxID=3155157 RepID=UPI0033F77F26
MTKETDRAFPVAVIGMAGRFPGAEDLSRYWDNVCQGVSGISTVEPDDPAPNHVGASGRLTGVDEFDAGFFGMTPMDARLTDPQHRLFLETCYHALEDAGYPAEPPDQRIGVFAGSGMNLYPQRSYLLTQLRGGESDDPVSGLRTAIGNQPDFLSTRVSFRLGLTGPAVGVQTACSTSLVALHLATQALAQGDADMALVGASALHVPQEDGYRYTEGSILSETGVCRPFSAEADGTVGGSGVAAIVVKPLDAAIADRDPIHAVVLGTAVNNDGAAKVGYTAPSVTGQARVVRDALDRAAVRPESIGYVEAHGTGTALGDPIEVRGLTQAFRSGTDHTGYCYLGSVKANIGHLDSCAGMAGLIKAVLMVRHGVIPGQINLGEVNPALRLEETPFRITEKTVPWPVSKGPRRAGVCSLGVGGTNAHVVVEEPPTVAARSTEPGPGVLPLSAHTPDALAELAGRYRDRLRGGAEPGALFAAAVSNARPMRHRVAVTGGSADELADALNGIATGEGDGDRWIRPATGEGEAAGGGRPVFLYPGQGPHAPGMARSLYRDHPRFRAVLDECDALHEETWGGGLRSVLVDGEGPRTWPTDVLQPALFTYQAALTELWRELGVEASHVVGHSAGEYAALWAAGAFSLEDGLHLSAVRGRLMRELTTEGAMIAVFADSAVVAEVVAEHPGVEVSVVNGAAHHVLGGPVREIDGVEQDLERRGVHARRLTSDRAFHTALMDPVLDLFDDHAQDVSPAPLTLPFSSNLGGRGLGVGVVLDSDYLRRQIRETARFDLALGDARDGGHWVFLEIGPGAILTGIGRREAPESVFVSSHAPEVSPEQDVREALARLHTAGVGVRWDALVPAGTVRDRMPPYPFRRDRHWADPPADAPVQEGAPADPLQEPTAQTDEPTATGMDMTRDEPSAADVLLEHVIDVVLERAAHHFGMAKDQIAVEDAFIDLGADSLGMVNMLRDVEQAFSVRVSMRELFEAADSTRRLAEVVIERLDPERADRLVADQSPEPEPAEAAAPAPARTEPAPAGSAVPAPVETVPATPIVDPAPPVPPVSSTASAAPAAPAAPATGVERLIDQQLSVMRQLSGVMANQIALVQGTGAAPAAQDTPGTAPGSSAPKAAPASAAAPDTTANSANGADEANGANPATKAPGAATSGEPRVHGPRVSVALGSGMVTRESSPERQRHLEDLVRRYETATRTSKDIAQRHRAALADSRSVVGFRSATKEMLYPLAARKARGSWVEDVDGNRYVDITMGFGILLFGHEPEFVTDAVRKHLEGGLRIGPRNEETGEAAELLTRITGTDRAAFATSGTEANSAAIRLARAYTGRHKVVMFEGSYHGHIDSVLARSVPDGDGLRTIPVSNGIPDSAVSEVIVLEYGAPESLRTIDRLGPEIAAVVVEPVQSRRPSLQPGEFVRELREVTRRHGSVLLFDEMLTGFRPHLRGARGFFGVEPDLATYGKALGGGFPIGAIAGRADIMDGVDGGYWRYGDDSFPPSETTFFGGTYTQHPLAMSAARAVLSHLELHSPELQDRLNARTQGLAETLNAFFEEEEHPVRVAHFGSQFRFEYRGNMELFFHHLLLNGVYVWEWRNFFLSTAHTDEDIDHIVRAVRTSMHEMRRGGLFPSERRTLAVGTEPAGRRTPLKAPAADSRETTAPVPTTPVEVPRKRTTTPDFSIYFFGDYPEDVSRDDAYRMIQECARFGDEHGFHAVWLPERHFHSFGGIFPNPSVLAASLATQTTRIRLNSGSVVLPLHNPIRVAEEWSLVDNLSGGRVGLGCASGWHANDFVFFPERYGRHKEMMYEQIDTVRHLWRGGKVPGRSGTGDRVEVGLHPRPVQNELPMSVAIVGNPDSYRAAARHGLDVVTNLMGQSIEQLAENVALYRTTRAEHGHDPYGGRVTVLAHTYLGRDVEQARAAARDPFCRYLRSSLSLFGQTTNSLGFSIDLENTPEEDVDFMLDMAFERYCESRALIGTPDSCAPVVDALLEAGADEIAAFVDFGLPPEAVLDGLTELDRVRERYQGGERTASADAELLALPGGPPVTEVAPLSFAQQRIWFLERLLPGRSTYMEVNAIDLRGRVDVPGLRAALRYVVDRHPALRTVFPDVDGEPRQVVLGHVDVECVLSEHVGADAERTVREGVAEEGRRHFDLENGPLLRARVLRLAEDHHVLVLSMHHIIVDSISALVLTKEISEVYRAGAESRAVDLPDPRTTYTRFAREQRSAVERGSTDRSLRYWEERLAGPLPELRLPLDRPRPESPIARGRSLFHLLPGDLSERVRALSRTRRATLFMTLVAGLGTVLQRFSGQDDILVGTPVSGRPEGTEELVGFFANTLALRLDLSGDPAFTEMLDKVKGTLLDAYEHDDAPFEEVVRRVNPDRAPGRSPIFQVMVEFENEAIFELDLPDVEARLLGVGVDKAPFDLTLYLANLPEGIQCQLEYNADVFDESTARRIIDYLEGVLRAAVEAPEERLSRLTGVSERDRSLLLDWERDDEAPSECLHQLVERRVEADPDGIAVVDAGRDGGGGGGMSYWELNATANRLARRLRAAGVGPDDRVGVRLPRSPELVAALLAVAKAGGAYVPLDLLQGEERLAFMLADSGARVLLTDADGAEVAPEGLTVVRVDGAGDDAGDASGDLDCVTTPDNLLYCLYTSGSTGRPKGVEMPHRGLVNLVDWYTRNHAPARTLQFASCGFDVASQEIFTTLASGETLVLVSEEQRFDPPSLARVVRTHRVERVIMPFTPLRYLVEALSAEGPVPSLREVVNTAERLTVTEPLRRFLADNPDCALYNEYGPTETHFVTSHRVVDLDDRVPPVGRPVAGTTIRVLDSAGQPVPVGAVGMIHVSGNGVARGYRGRPEETARVFGDDPFAPGSGRRMYRTGDLGRWRGDGTLEYLGRDDGQVKIRGWRVEPGEVEHVLNSLEGVRQAVVVARDDEGAQTYLAAYVLLADGGADRPAAEKRVAALARERLPHYMVPRAWVFPSSLPTNVNGKVDRDALPAPAPTAGPVSGARAGSGPVSDDEGTGSAPRGHAERIRKIWESHLGATDIGLDRSFFEVGGHSLQAVGLLNRVRDELGVAITLTEFFRAPTVRGMAESASRLSGAPQDDFRPSHRTQGVL